MSFDKVFENMISQYVDEWSAIANNQLLQSIELVPFLTKVKHFYFCKAGDFVGSFVIALVQIVTYFLNQSIFGEQLRWQNHTKIITMCLTLFLVCFCIKKKKQLQKEQWGKEIEINNALEREMKQSVFAHLLPQKFFICLSMYTDLDREEAKVSDNTNPKEMTVVEQVSKLQLQCDVQWPLHVVLNPLVMGHYNKIARFLLQLRVAKHLLSQLHVELNLLCNKRLSNHVLHTFQLLRRQMSLFINTLNDYCLLQVLFVFVVLLSLNKIK
ncbi:tubulin [Reticulomyxa filosa]|uniref:Spindle pole body component n=1 Tax=Reticulomyxa filosa TaxID=46433 RepID=X6NAW0_RETFI|nr:tubulin [Reticulomyxa filosa]|eukprot:ETO22879.1 tubulin [Reticulomyxa filosa]